MHESDEHHYIFKFKGIIVEIHNELCGSRLKKDFKPDVHDWMASLLRESLNTQDFFIVPSATFNVAYVLQHMYSHGYCNFISLRQFCDLAVLMRENAQDIHWEQIQQMVYFTEINKFFDVVISVLGEHFKMEKILPSGMVNIDICEANNMMADTCSKRNFMSKRFPQIDKYYHFRWHYKFYHNQHWLLLTIKNTMDYIHRNLQ